MQQWPTVAVVEGGNHLPRIVGEVGEDWDGHRHIGLEGRTTIAKWTSSHHGIDKRLTPSSLHLEDALDALVLHGSIEPRGYHDVATFLQVCLHLGKDVRIGCRGFSEQDHIPLCRELWNDLDRKACHTHVVVQEFLSLRIERLVGRDALRVA